MGSFEPTSGVKADFDKLKSMVTISGYKILRSVKCSH